MLDTSGTVMVKAMVKIFLWKLLRQRRYVLERLMKSLCQDMKNHNLLMKNHNLLMKILLHLRMRNPYQLMKNMITHNLVMKNLLPQGRNLLLYMAPLQPQVNPLLPLLPRLPHICLLEMLELAENRN